MAQSDTTSTNSAPSSSTTPKTHKAAMSPEQRKEFMKLIGLTGADLKGLSREDRTAKIKEAAGKTIDELKAKQASGTITAQEQTDLDKIQKFMANVGHRRAQNTASN
jgi:hypothetical protein